MCKEYNGYTNYPTWNVALWIDNDEGMYDMAREVVGQDFEYDFQREVALKNMLDEFIPDLGASMQADLLGWALSNVNWIEIVDNLLEA